MIPVPSNTRVWLAAGVTDKVQQDPYPFVLVDRFDPGHEIGEGTAIDSHHVARCDFRHRREDAFVITARHQPLNQLRRNERRTARSELDHPRDSQSAVDLSPRASSASNLDENVAWEEQFKPVTEPTAHPARNRMAGSEHLKPLPHEVAQGGIQSVGLELHKAPGRISCGDYAAHAVFPTDFSALPAMRQR